MLSFVRFLFAFTISSHILLVSTSIALVVLISVAEFITKRGWLDEVKLYRAYALPTVVIGVVVLVLLSSLVGGQGVNLASGSFSFASWATAGSIGFILGTPLLGIGFAPVFFDLPPQRGFVLPFAGAGVVLSVASYWLMSPALVTWWMSVPVLLTLLAGTLYLWPTTVKIVTNKGVFLTVLSVIVFSLQFLVYPNAIGQALPIDAVTTAGAMADAFASMPIVGGSLLAVMPLLYVRIAARGPSGPDLR